MAISFATSGPHHLAEFRRQVGAFREVWHSLDVRYSAVQIGSDWFNFITDILLSPAEVSTPHDEPLVELSTFVALSRKLPISHLDGILDEIGQGAIRVHDHNVRLAQPPRQVGDHASAYPLQPFFRRSEAGSGWKPFWDPGRESVGFELEAHGGSLHELLPQERLGELERQLLVHSPPYFGLLDLSRYFLRSNAPGLSGGGQLNVRAPLYTWVEDLQLEGDSALQLLVHCPSTISVNKLRLVARGVHDDEIVRFDLNGAGLTREGESGELIRFRIPVEDLSWIEGVVVLQDLRVDQFVFSLPLANSPNPRYDAIYTTDVGERRLRQFVGGDSGLGRIENQQVIGLTWILQLCGFQVLPAGLSGLNMGDSPDLFAFVPLSSSALVVEATTRDLAADGKLVKLHDRAEGLRRRLPNHDVVAVAATGKPTVTQPEADLAHRLGIVILAQSQLEELRIAAEQNTPTGKVFERIKQLRPPVSGAT
jgi:hypothetical protein